MGARMSDDEIGPILLSATAVALSARTGGLQLHQVDALEDQARALPPDHPLRFDALSFVLHWREYRRDPEAIAELGEALDRGIARVLRKDPIDRNRSDIHG